MIIDVNYIRSMVRPISTDEALAVRLISEAEREDLRQAIGDALYVRVTSEEAEDDSAAQMLLDGCTWTDCTGRTRVHFGIRLALGYYAYARIIRDGNVAATRYGAVVKDDQHSRNAELEERRRQAAEVFAQADGYMGEIRDFLRASPQLYPEYCEKSNKAGYKANIRIIGE